MTLPERLAAFRANFEAGGPSYNAPAWVHEVMHRATDELIASGAAGRALKAGDRAPDFILRDAENRDVSSRNLLEKGPLVVTFYRGVWCTHCNMDLQALQRCPPWASSAPSWLQSRRRRRPTAASLGAITRSPSRFFRIRAMKLRRSSGCASGCLTNLIQLYRDTFKNDLSQINGDSSWTLPMPARYVISHAGLIAYAEVNPDYTSRPDPQELLPVLAALKNLRAA